MAEPIKETFIKINYQDEVFLIILMGKYIMEIIVIIRKKVMEFFISMKNLNMLEILEMVRWMVKGYFLEIIKKCMEFGGLEN